MVKRGYPEDIIKVPAPQIINEGVPTEVENPREIIRYVYVSQDRLQLDPNAALITLGIITVIGIITLAVIYKK